VSVVCVCACVCVRACVCVCFVLTCYFLYRWDMDAAGFAFFKSLLDGSAGYKGPPIAEEVIAHDNTTRHSHACTTLHSTTNPYLL